MASGLRLLCYAGRRRLLSPGPRRGFSSSTREPLHVCVVGSGPAGFYAADRVDSILDDDKNGVATSPFDLKKQGREGLLEILERKNVCFVPFSVWERIDSKETMAGQLVNKPREKIITWDGLLKAANEE